MAQRVGVAPAAQLALGVRDERRGAERRGQYATLEQLVGGAARAQPALRRGRGVQTWACGAWACGRELRKE